MCRSCWLSNSRAFSIDPHPWKKPTSDVLKQFISLFEWQRANLQLFAYMWSARRGYRLPSSPVPMRLTRTLTGSNLEIFWWPQSACFYFLWSSKRLPSHGELVCPTAMHTHKDLCMGVSVTSMDIEKGAEKMERKICHCKRKWPTF